MCYNLIIRNPSYSVRRQLVTAFIVTSVLAIAIVIGISVGLTQSLANEVKETAKVELESQAQRHAQSTAVEIAAAMEQKLSLIANSIVMTSVRQAALYSIRTDTTSPNVFTSNVYTTAAGFPLKTYYGFREFNFIPGCTASQQCPADYDSMNGRSVLGNTVFGSIQSSSMYAFDTISQCAVKTDASWNYMLSSYPTLSTIINNTNLLDFDYRNFYTMLNTSLFYYLSIYHPSSGYALHRTYPGMIKDTTACGSLAYNPTSRSWYRNAPENGLNVEFYRETFTNELVLNFGSKVTTPVATFVATALLLLRDISVILENVVVGSGGFAALVDRNTQQVLVFSNRPSSQLYNDNLNRFVYLSEIDASIPFNTGLSASVISHRFNNIDFFVAFLPILSNKFVLMLYLPRDDYFTTYKSLQSSITETANQATTAAVVLTLVGLCIVITVASILTMSLTSPLTVMQQACDAIAYLSTREDRDYRSVLTKYGGGFASVKQVQDGDHAADHDEIHQLATDFFAVVAKLDNTEIAKKQMPKYPANPMFAQCALLGASPNLILEHHHALMLPSEAHQLGLMHAPSSHPPASFDHPSSFTHLNRIPSSNESLPPAYDAEPSSVAPASSDIMIEMSRMNEPGSSNQSDTSSPCVPAGSFAAADVSQIHLVVPQFQASPFFSPVVGAATTKIPAAAPQASSFWTSLTCKIRVPIPTLLISFLLAAMIAPLVILVSQGNLWLNDTSRLMTQQEVANLVRTASFKALFAQLFYSRINFDTALVSRFVTTLLLDSSRPLQISNWEASGLFLPSYSLDSLTSTSGSPTFGTSTNLGYSGYFLKDAQYCGNYGTCNSYRDMQFTRQSSILDLKFRAYFHANTMLDFIQLGWRNGFTRVYPWSDKRTYADGSACLVDADPAPSGCSACTLASPPFAPYNPLCRSWYSLASSKNDPSRVYFQNPRKASSGNFVATSVQGLRSNTSSTLNGTLIFNVLAQSLSDSVNKIKILDSGYVYMLDENGLVVLHPRLSSSTSCFTVQCVENLGNSDTSRIIDPLSSKLTGTATVRKDGSDWQVVYASVALPTTTYGLVAQVPQSEIEAPAAKAKDKISSALNTQIAVFAVLLVVVSLAVMRVTNSVASSLVDPIQQLRRVCTSILNDDLSHGLSKSNVEDASSSDMAILYDAFSSLLTSLRFGSDSYLSGDINRAKVVFDEAKQLFTRLNNQRGIGIANNNLGSVSLRLGELQAAEEFFKAAITSTRQYLSKLEKDEGQSMSQAERTTFDKNRQRAQKQLADRLGNLAAVYFEQKRFADTERCIDEALPLDRTSRHIRGQIQRLGIRGQVQLYMNQVSAARATLEMALSSIREINLQDVSSEELAVCHSYALLNLSQVISAEGDLRAAYEVLVLAVCSHQMCDRSAVMKCLTKLKELASKMDDANFMNHIQNVMKYAQPVVNKDVVFSLDYSGSMAGSRIKRAVDNMLKLFDQHLSNEDGVAFLRFNQKSEVVFPLTLKSSAPRFLLADSTHPGGPTAFRDSIADAIKQLQLSASFVKGSNLRKKWVVSLTDGEDNSSQMSLPDLKNFISQSGVSLVVVGINLGEPIRQEILQITSSCEKGVFIDVSADSSEQLSQAFAQVANLISQDVQLEDM